MSRGHPVPFPALPVQASVSDPHNPDMAQRGRSFLCPSFFQEEFRIQVMNQERVQITTIEERLTSESWTVTFQIRPGGPVGGEGCSQSVPHQEWPWQPGAGQPEQGLRDPTLRGDGHTQGGPVLCMTVTPSPGKVKVPSAQR